MDNNNTTTTEELDPQTQLDRLTVANQALTEQLAQRDAKLAASNAEVAVVKKDRQLELLIRRSGSWVDEDAVRVLIGGKFEVDEGGNMRTVSGQRPETVIKEFVRDFPFMAAEDKSTSSEGAGKYKLEDIFGAKSSAKKAMALMNADPAEYRRMKILAKQAGLVVN